MNETPFARSVLSAIKARHLTPRPFWNFAAAEAMLWVAAVSAAIFGGLSYAVAYRILVNEEWDLYRQAGLRFVEVIPNIFPYVWSVFFVTFFAIAIHEFRRTENGYRFGPGTLGVLLLVAASVAGIALRQSPVTQAFEDAIETAIPVVGQMDAAREEIWSNPETGLLGGTVIEVRESTGTIVLEDASGETWNVRVEGQDASSFEVGQEVKVLGTLEEDDSFDATTLQPSKEKQPVRRRTRPNDRGRNADRD